MLILFPINLVLPWAVAEPNLQLRLGCQGREEGPSMTRGRPHPPSPRSAPPATQPTTPPADAHRLAPPFLPPGEAEAAARGGTRPWDGDGSRATDQGDERLGRPRAQASRAKANQARQRTARHQTDQTKPTGARSFEPARKTSCLTAPEPTHPASHRAAPRMYASYTRPT